MLPKILVFMVLCAVTLIQCKYYRLPKDVKPTRYYLTMEPHLHDNFNIRVYWEKATYNGTITIELKILNNTNSITLHAQYFVINKNNIDIVNDEDKKISISSTTDNRKNQTFTINTASELLKGVKYNLTIKFSGILRNGEGFFMATYAVNSTLHRQLAVTHFEPTSARTAFPCFDEPALKAPFIISLIRKENYNSISNAKLEKTEDLGNNRFKDTFEETPKMSTFTVAFAISDFLSTETIDGHRVLGRPNEIIKGMGEYPLQIGIETLKKLEDYTGIKFPINKMEQFAVPSGYFWVFDAMENYGLVIYGEEHLLRNNQSSEEDIKRTTIYISHEFAHMWFGNLVTPVWWKYLWLSESLATYFQYFMASRIKPDWKLMDQFLVDVFNKAMYKEEFNQAAPLNYKITRIGQYPPFHIMYEKGASIIRMMSHFLTPQVFKNGLHIYLNNMKFRNSKPRHLYKGFQQAVDEVGVKSLLGNYSVSDILTTWDSSKGFPKITVTRDYTTGSITIQQEDTFKNKPKASWVIPINYVFSAEGKIDFSQTTADFWINKDTEVLTNDYPTDGWLILNKQQFGYYRVNYDIENWNRIIDYMNTENFANIHPLNRAQLIDDAFNFAYNGKIPYDIPLRLCDYLTRERHYVPLVTFYEAISNSYIHFYSFSAVHKRKYKYFKNYTLTNTISPTTDHLSEIDVFRQYKKNTLQGVHDYYKNKPATTDSHIDKLGRAKFNRYRYLFKD